MEYKKCSERYFPILNLHSIHLKESRGINKHKKYKQMGNFDSLPRFIPYHTKPHKAMGGGGGIEIVG